MLHIEFRLSNAPAHEAQREECTDSRLALGITSPCSQDSNSKGYMHTSIGVAVWRVPTR